MARERFVERYQERGWADEFAGQMRQAKTLPQVRNVIEETKSFSRSLPPEKQNGEAVRFLL